MKIFIGASEIYDLENALGQYVLYRSKMKRQQPERELFLAIREAVFTKLLKHPDADFLLVDENVRLLIFSEIKEEIIQWIP